jgi:hypothetical protein
MDMKKTLIFTLIIVPMVFGAFKLTDRVAFDRAEWTADFEQLEREIEANYANLKWARSAKSVNLVELDRTARAALANAQTKSEARAALTAFIAGFDDGHFHIASGPPRPVAAVMKLLPERTSPRVGFDMKAQEACRAFGFSRKRHALQIEHPQLVQATSTEFAAGVLTLEDGRKFGVIRIPLFQQYDYAASCERAWRSFSAGRAGTCDDSCRQMFNDAAKHEIAAQLAREARSMAHAVDGVIVDLTGNGGGTEWADDAAAALTPVELRRAPGAFVRGEHWTRAFAGDIETFESERNLPDLAIARAMQDSARARCNLAGIWKDRAYVPQCWNIVPQTPYTKNHFGDLTQADPYDGPLFIMVDEGTASASEQFTAVLRDNDAAVVIGTRTMGVGCGYTNGGIPIVLRNSRLAIQMPDCARMRADGSNEYEGVRPDIAADWGTSAASKGMALEKAMRSVR